MLLMLITLAEALNRIMYSPLILLAVCVEFFSVLY